MTWTRNPLLRGAKSLAPGLYGCGPGGTHTQGAVYRLTPPSPPGSGQWTETILYQFGSQPNDPSANGNESNQQCGLAQDPWSGKLYGTTGGGGTHGQGTVFELDPPAQQGGPWTETVLHSFTGLADGEIPWGTPLFDHGRLYGVTFASKPHAKAPYGTVWEYTP